MRIITFQVNSQTRWGALKENQVIDLNLAYAMYLASRGQEPQYLAQNVLDFIERGESAWDVARATLEFLGDRVIEGVMFPLHKVKLLAPIPRPPAIIGIGLNYRDHARETGKPFPPVPILFAKLSSSVIGPYDPIHVHPDVTQRADYEAELGVVIGRRATRVQPAEALEYVFGFTVINDVSARDLQHGAEAGGQWVRGKSLDTFCPMGPSIVTRDEVPDPQNLALYTRLNGQVLQDSNTREMIFSVRDLIAFISQGITLEPGVVIATGTPHGVGDARRPPIYLKKGDLVEIEVEGIGKLRNPVEN